MNMCILKKFQRHHSCLCADNIIPLLEEASFPWSSALPGKRGCMLAGKINVHTALQVIIPNGWNKPP